MLRNYLTTTLRHLLKQRAYAMLNVLGLAMGITCCLLVLLDIQYELTYDAFHEKAERIYRLEWDGLSRKGARSAEELTTQIPEVEATARFRSFRPLLVYGDQQLYERITFAEEIVFDVFSFSLLAGDPKTALTQPRTMVISEEVAERFFGDEDPMGKTLMWDNEFPYLITGVMQNSPRNTFWPMGILASLITMQESEFVEEDRTYATFVLLHEGARYDQVAFAKKVQDFYRRSIGEAPVDAQTPHLSALRDLHLNDELVSYLYSLGAIGFFILTIACINFTNLTTARGATRSREVGLRKALGAHRSQLASQFLGESILMAAIALLLSLLSTWLLLPAYASFVGKDLTFSLISNPVLLLGALGIAVVVGLLGGGYPALVMSSYRPAFALKGDTQPPGGGLTLRGVLVTFQFIVAAGLIIGTGVVYQQLQYMRSKDLGINRDHITAIHMHNKEVKALLPGLRADLEADPRILGTTITSQLPPALLIPGSWRGEGMDENEDRIARLLRIDHNSFDIYGFRVIAGRRLASDGTEESAAVCLINETMLREFGFEQPEQALGQSLTWRSPPWWQYHNLQGEPYRDKTATVIGVVQNAHFEPLHLPIRALILFPEPSWTIQLSVLLDGDDIPGGMAHLRRTWEGYVPTLPLNANFVDQRFANAYQAEERFGNTIGIFASLAIAVTCLGVFGLGAFAIARRTKEIGIRKSLGASDWQLTLLLSKEPLRIALLASVLAAPLAGYAMSSWLQLFTFRMQLGAGVFLGAAAVVLVVAWAAVGPLALRAARGNAVDNLRYD
ncbi:MAG: FtsX-like permease family protein [Gemmatimonadetes bacterium]|jgi:putative ABC transport system permease protein|nr:FtsX-like permease family protein [Gemmatimonadota bacterium]MBT5590408.1 FtsX-like permease family protein [Gemmatimonadota bacterium]MBT5964245.1 FtsX-like permease family protein [Gemmatimonadota bacterium]MBT7456001.1 FtsX-like permease family protein [Gemmatimonadota bacterium]MBT7595233.1 FtsX-like permease family protein [Gemmatimonadota bacterium]